MSTGSFELPSLNRARDVAGYIEDLIYVSRCVDQVAKIICGFEIENKPEIEKGILMGYMVHSFKLYDSIILLLDNRRLEPAWVLTRALFDAAIQLIYLIQKLNKDISEKIVKSDLAFEKQLLEEIQKQIKKAGQDAVYKLMIDSIKRKFDDESILINEVDFDKHQYWCNLNTKQMAKKVGLLDLYEFLYRISSKATHGSWGFLKEYNLIKKNGSFEPNIVYHTPPVQMFFLNNLLMLTVSLEYSSLLPENDSRSRSMKEDVNRILDWHNAILTQIEKYFYSDD